MTSEERLFDGRSRTGTLRDDSMGESRDDTPKRHPDNAPGQDLGLRRVFETRSRAKASRDDKLRLQGRLYAMTISDDSAVLL